MGPLARRRHDFVCARILLILEWLDVVLYFRPCNIVNHINLLFTRRELISILIVILYVWYRRRRTYVAPVCCARGVANDFTCSFLLFRARLGIRHHGEWEKLSSNNSQRSQLNDWLSR